jgi:hypothetical protein
MPVYELSTQVLTPEDEKTLSFTCEHPSRFFSFLPRLTRQIFRITSSHWFEDRIKWDVGDTSVQFFGVWRGEDSKDSRTGVWITIKLQGEQKLDEQKMGNATIHLSAILRTKFPYLTILDKGLYKSYTYLFYNKQRRYYMEEARQRLLQLENEIKKIIGVQVE